MSDSESLLDKKVAVKGRYSYKKKIKKILPKMLANSCKLKKICVKSSVQTLENP